MLYEPLLEEIQPLMQRAAARWPHLASRVAKAEQLLVERNLTAGATWMVYSQSGRGCYTVHTDATPRGCTCYDYEATAPYAEGRKFCKHLIAVSAYVEIIRCHLPERIQGSDGERNGALRFKHPRNQYLLRIGSSREICSEDRRIHFHTRWTPRGQTFAGDADAITFATWLASAESLPDPNRFEYGYVTAVEATGMVYNAWTTAQWQHYFATGETPAMARMSVRRAA